MRNACAWWCCRRPSATCCRCCSRRPSSCSRTPRWCTPSAPTTCSRASSPRARSTAAPRRRTCSPPSSTSSSAWACRLWCDVCRPASPSFVERFPMIEIKNVSKWYGPVQVLTDCSVTINKGDVVVVCGPSGSGKSTLIKTVNGLEPVQKGDITVDGVPVTSAKTDLPKLRSRVGMVFQHFELFPHLSVTENLTIAQMKVLGRSADEAKVRGMKMLDRVGLMAHKDKFPGQLSGGQQQRVEIG